MTFNSLIHLSFPGLVIASVQHIAVLKLHNSPLKFTFKMVYCDQVYKKTLWVFSSYSTSLLMEKFCGCSVATVRAFSWVFLKYLVSSVYEHLLFLFFYQVFFQISTMKLENVLLALLENCTKFLFHCRINQFFSE